MTALLPFAPGDIFVTASDLDESARFPTGRGKILQFAADWTLKASAATGHTGLISSLTIDGAGNLHALDPQARARSSFGPDGRPITLFAAMPAIALGSMLVLGADDFLVGEHMVGTIPGFSGDGKVYRINAAGDVRQTYDTETNGGMGGFLGVTHMALAPDRETLFHTSETGAVVYAHDLAGNRRLGAVFTRTDPPPLLFGIAAPADGSLIVACGADMRRIAPGEGEIRRYAMPEGRGWAVPVLRAGGETFWALDFFGGQIALIDTASGALIYAKELGLGKCLTGIAEMPA